MALINTVTSNTALIPAGTHILVLASCAIKHVSSQFASSADGMVDKFLWRFETEQPDADGQRYEYAVWTGLTYGNEKAAMTLLLDQLVPGMTLAKSVNFNTDTLVGKRFRARIVHKTNPTTGKVTAQHIFIEPLDDDAGPTVPLTGSTGTVPPVTSAVKPVLAAPFDGDDSSWN